MTAISLSSKLRWQLVPGCVVLGMLCAGASDRVLADSLFGESDMKEVAAEIAKGNCSESCATTNWRLSTVGVGATDEKEDSGQTYLAIPNEMCGSRGCPAAYLFADGKYLTKVGEGFGLGQRLDGDNAPPVIPPPAERSAMLQVPLK